jgi:2-keto-4-pentenoate hydratase/2-oxohepta-3-ene-1,7-dioic acid hydratase in catechol pathway
MADLALLNMAEGGRAVPAVKVGGHVLPVAAALSAAGKSAAFPAGIFLKPGQQLSVEIEGIGRLHNPIVAGE